MPTVGIRRDVECIPTIQLYRFSEDSYSPFQSSLPFEHLHHTRGPCVPKILVSFHVGCMSTKTSGLIDLLI